MNDLYHRAGTIEVSNYLMMDTPEVAKTLSLLGFVPLKVIKGTNSTLMTGISHLFNEQFKGSVPPMYKIVVSRDIDDIGDVTYGVSVEEVA